MAGGRLTVGAFIVFLMKLEPGGDDIKRAKPEQQKADKVAETSKPAQATPQQPVKPKYDFYTLLPESEVIVPPEAVPEKTPRSRPSRSHGYPLKRRKSTRRGPRQHCLAKPRLRPRQ